MPTDSTLDDLIDANGLQSLMNDFYDVAGIPMSIIDIDGRTLVGVGWQDACTKFHRVHPDTCRACLESDTQLTTGIPPGEFRLYRCKNHMWDVATPLMVRDRQMGNVFCGQFFFDDETIDYDLFRRQARRYLFDEDEYLAALDRVPRLSRAKLERGLQFFKKLAQMVSRLGDANLTLARTISERDNLTQSLRESQADLARAQAVAQTGSWRLDVRSNVLLWSDEVYRMFGVPRGTRLTYDTFLAAIHPEDRAAVDRAWKAALEGQPYDVDHRIRVGAREKWVRERAELEFDAEGRLEGGFGTVQDITERKRLEAELRANVRRLREANRLKDEFLSTLSHELRTPLNAVFGWTQMLLKDAVPRETQRHALEAIDRNARAQVGLVNDVLDVARVVSGKLRLELKDVDVVSCLDAALDAVRPAAAAKQIEVQCWIGEHAAVQADPGRLQQVLWNLLSNAVKFTPAGGRIDVSVDQVNDCLEVSVQDTGIGIDPVFLPHVFDRFRQADGSSTRSHAGLGLGLAIVRHLVELHGGDVRASSDGPGCGATFTVSLRTGGGAAALARQEGGVNADGDGMAAAPGSLAGVRVLAVDDEADARELLALMLGTWGAEVRAVATVRDALAAVQAWRPHVIICDIAMPGQDGYTFLRRLQSLAVDQGGTTPALALTASVGAAERAKALAAGFIEHVTKPVQPERLAKVVLKLASIGREGS